MINPKIKQLIKDSKQHHVVFDFQHDSNIVFLTNSFSRAVLASSLSLMIHIYLAKQHGHRDFEFMNSFENNLTCTGHEDKDITVNSLHTSQIENAKTILNIISNPNASSIALTKFDAAQLLVAVSIYTFAEKSSSADKFHQAVENNVLEGLIKIAMGEYEVSTKDLDTFGFTDGIN